MVILKEENGNVRERRYTKCNKNLAAYLVGEGGFMGMSINLKIRMA